MTVGAKQGEIYQSFTRDDSDFLFCIKDLNLSNCGFDIQDHDLLKYDATRTMAGAAGRQTDGSHPGGFDSHTRGDVPTPEGVELRR
jgi:hypothetical protein